MALKQRHVGQPNSRLSEKCRLDFPQFYTMTTEFYLLIISTKNDNAAVFFTESNISRSVTELFGFRTIKQVITKSLGREFGSIGVPRRNECPAENELAALAVGN